MRAVDFVIELDDCYRFIEIKDPQNPGAPVGTDARYAQTLLSGGITDELKYKYRDSFLYEWASGRADKPVDYLVLIALEEQAEPQLSRRLNDVLEAESSPETGACHRLPWIAARSSIELRGFRYR